MFLQVCVILFTGEGCVSQHALQQVSRVGVPGLGAWSGGAWSGRVPGQGVPGLGGPALGGFWFGGLLVQSGLLVWWPSGLAAFWLKVVF